ncbi:hypothetical protein F4780DRAFT_379456 [Xylariomycetidae sp. FL0641]|nr:hypothetical protein F4780DRAFT_379456 [Xylariomycetidae sp. FL0641]
MSGILGSYSDGTCNSHNALSGFGTEHYACGVTFDFKDVDDPPPGLQEYAVVTVEECCAKANRSVLRIPGNSGCEMQFCIVPESASSFSYTQVAAYETGSGTAARTPDPTYTTGVVWGPPDDVDGCLSFVYEGDLPATVSEKVARVGNWCVVQMGDSDIVGDEVKAYVTAASPAPPSWTSAAVGPFDKAFSSMSAASAAAAAKATSDPTTGGGVPARHVGAPWDLGMRIWTVAAILTLGLAIAL